MLPMMDSYTVDHLPKGGQVATQVYRYAGKVSADSVERD